jgi:RNA polymerase sigma factor (sigma-70 family)
MTPAQRPERDASLEQLLTRLHDGDIEAAEQLFRSYEPYLRLLVRRQLSGDLRAKFDSLDIIHSVWTDLLDGFRSARWQFDDPNQLRAFLVKATQHRLIDKARRHLRPGSREEPLQTRGRHPASPAPSPTDEAAAHELWDKLLMLCPPQHRALLDLKRQGFALAEIAERTGLHASSVRRILYDLARRAAQTSKEPRVSGK